MRAVYHEVCLDISTTQSNTESVYPLRTKTGETPSAVRNSITAYLYRPTLFVSIFPSQ